MAWLLKTYVYISDSKVDMLYPQIPQKRLSKIATELKINLGILSLKFGHQPTEKNRQDKLNLIIRYLKEEGAVGTVDSTKEYFEGVLPMRGTPWPYIEKGMVYFGGTTKSGTVLGLGGSIHHCIGELRGETDTRSYSGLGPLITKLTEELDPARYGQLMNMYHSARGLDGRRLELTDELVLRLTAEVTRYDISGPTQNLEFVAKRLVESLAVPDLWHDPNTKLHVVLGTPIYVAQVD